MQSINQQQRLQIHVHFFIYYHKREQVQVSSYVRAFICALRAVSVIALEIGAFSLSSKIGALESIPYSVR
jgi:hypothetical protein